MINRSRAPLDDINPKGIGPVNFRNLALLLMIAGAIGFVISLVVFGEQLLCLLGSTVVVFIGLGIIIKSKKNERNLLGSEDFDTFTEQPYRRSIASQKLWGKKTVPAQAPAPVSWSQANIKTSPTEDNPLANIPASLQSENIQPGRLCLQAVEFFRQQGAKVQIDTQREDRSILYVSSQAGKSFSIIIYEGTQIIGVTDLRALYSLMVSTGAEGAILISANSFTAQAHEWALKRSIQLISGSRIGEIIIS